MMIRLSLVPPSPVSPMNQQLNNSKSSRSFSSNYESLKDVVIQNANTGNINAAISTLNLISNPDPTTYSVILKSCIRTRNLKLGQLIHSKLTSSLIQLDTILYNSLITLYSKCGQYQTAQQLFSSMPTHLRDLVSWSAIISCYAHNGLHLQALLMFNRFLFESGEIPNEFCYSAVIRACSNTELAAFGFEVFGFLIKTGHFDADVCVGCALIDLFAKGFCDIESARKVFDRMPERNSVLWTQLITRYTHLGFQNQAVGLFLDMVETGFAPDRFTFSCVFSACAELQWYGFGQQLHGWVVKNGLCLDVCVGCSLVNMYAKCGEDGAVVDCRRVFDRMTEHNVMSWTAMITACVQNGGCDRDAIELYRSMIVEGKVKPNHFTFAGLLKACGNLSDPSLGEEIYNHAVKTGLASVNCVGNSLISMYAKTDRLEDARRAFEFLFDKNLVSYNTLVDGYARNSVAGEAFQLYNQIEDSGATVDAFTFASLLSGAASIGAIGIGEQIHARLIKSEFTSSQCVSNALISMYTRCGNIEASFLVFNEMKMEDRNVVSWTSIITGFAKHGNAERALGLYNRMLDMGIKPNEVTYIAVLSACSHAGLVDEGWRHFSSMHKEYGVRPRMEHYACMVDILGRSGLLNEAFDFIRSMPFTADALVWRTLLSACRVHGNMELGKYAAEMTLGQGLNDPAAYVLLSNMYASRGEWERVTEIRNQMKERNLVKEAGCSWVEIANKVHKFYVGDSKHPKASEIYKELDRLAFEIKKIGYVPDTSFVLHDLEEEQKEKYLFQHSEKVALAYGLISTAKGRPIRIFKNLRVCGDCHNAMKYISIVSGREIVVRDSSRFHHINQGVCTCNDYW